MIPQNDVTYNRVYYVVDEKFPNRNPSIAILPRIYDDQGHHKIAWQITSNREISQNFEKIIYNGNLGELILDSANPQSLKPPTDIKVTLDSGKVLVFHELTCDFYNKMNNVVKLRNFASDEELQDFYIHYEEYKANNS